MSSLREHDHGNIAIVTFFTRDSPSAMHKALATNTQGDLRATMGAFLPPTDLPFLILLLHPVEFPDEFNVPLYDAAEFSFGAPDEN